MKNNNRVNKTNNKLVVTGIILLLLILILGFGGYYVYTNFYKNKSENTTKLDDKTQPTNGNVSNNNKYKKVGDLRLLSWNVLNFGNKYTPSTNKFMNIVKTIQESNADVVGLTEINYNNEDIVRNVANSLGASWSYTFSGNNFNVNFSRSRESVAILYKNNVVQPETSNSINPNDTYTRPLWYTKFKTVGYDYSFITFFGHFDAPGANSKNNEANAKGYRGQGGQEISEAKAIATVFTSLKATYPNTDIIGAADTNIKEANNSVFDSNEYSLNYIDFNDNKEYYRTTISNNNYYANSYDKWFVYDANKSNILKDKNIPYKVDVINAFNDKIWDKEKTLNAWLSSDKAKKYPKPTDIQLVLNVSDHAPIILDLNYKNNM
ncbi:endonuclease/exonuclease/phosphatase family protein [Mycoplasma sp. T363T]|uniref:Endonuclease/exonuclease/phosphatase family protein n=1 Tax=Mycoplasma bradburyae TaxID=2963128 RepID=A0AAW6HQI2_9MOLU|nr:endonuclease/exonuclease/phosphatase family protein [Mycoplasma bradburyae]MDC4163226.1 endonuclease/exonuclease/phosphatase family protein [Mycoplasma bradburyae]MDC4181840.1 endonuclease/exonuclease/phosphatase family protein [Mycoplasma bradburyae]MDC4183215.1 endonuclease/exonuclease/phosphatase family protein [Mycoplasma bradburyae]UTS70139.1 endonuclease/exonuclease/phosphatase family protein [Mycoplasma bradburyae]